MAMQHLFTSPTLVPLFVPLAALSNTDGAWRSIFLSLKTLRCVGLPPLEKRSTLLLTYWATVASLSDFALQCRDDSAKTSSGR
ncbi:hypothetical protein ASPSYDRAFT_52556 [Aspergillus sydowii CBS 593.65]|uniref:Secreted protein n=1 Tax=Aspergillus sydowii CBS 593.65 TaxID=1036612 RepID=A0A1L9SXV3_9EURO|nr:uncharacterized protein ASPSYDRAFT_52556 [Aspergillus sydowii CBS 593.65]OJJ52052.1 hypothetical protein ASPSYDRAFT_52556 [Aspergillus sydowii CBS 593.65]